MNLRQRKRRKNAKNFPFHFIFSLVNLSWQQTMGNEWEERKGSSRSQFVNSTMILFGLVSTHNRGKPWTRPTTRQPFLLPFRYIYSISCLINLQFHGVFSRLISTNNWVHWKDFQAFHCDWFQAFFRFHVENIGTK